MHNLTLGPQGRGTVIEVLHKLADGAGLFITVRSPNDVGTTMQAIVQAAPRLFQDYDVRENDGLITSRFPMYVMYWGLVTSPSGSLAILVPSQLYEGQDNRDWISHFRVDVLDSVKTLSSLGCAVNIGREGSVSEAAFAREFQQASLG
ncbi:hypothetical protein [Actinomadura sp. 6K520]|uniref:hypothetical protein n=1 Tax=Actinomadura sp. 6K520 TaxID=2530364 RepID=UPI00105327B4|nr:hypothetical protein [Actinomadura sp. 6K520]TDE36419.1 hypothetical protein E1289_05955 [Actinomadura sp. 6K520]